MIFIPLMYICRGRYEGQFYEGVFYGRGKYTFEDGSYYDGEYVAVTTNKMGIKFPLPDGLRHGRGVRVWANGNRYEGAWIQDKMEGIGRLEYFNGDVYEGFFQQSVRHGQGTMTYGSACGAPYEGPLPLPSGHGKILKVVDGRHCKYVGQWAHDKWHGKGIYNCCK